MLQTLLDNRRILLIFSSFDSQTHLAAYTHNHIILTPANADQFPTLIASAVQFVLDQLSSRLQGRSWQIQVQA